VSNGRFWIVIFSAFMASTSVTIGYYGAATYWALMCLVFAFAELPDRAASLEGSTNEQK
jgi:hypothetical protein